jgi:putative ABC transport system permease protein
MTNHQPPKLARKIFEWYCGHAKVEDLLGDMDEWFYENLKTKSSATAKLIYWKHILVLMFSYAIKKRKRDARPGHYSTSTFSFDMLRNYIKVAVRNLYRFKYFTIVNAVGLAIGMSISLLFITLFAYVNTFDDFHTNGSRIYRVLTSYKNGLDQYDMASAPPLVGDRLKTELTGIESVTRITSNFFGDVVLNNIHVPLRGYYTDPEFLSIFSFELEKGNVHEALKKPNSIVITHEAEEKLFGSENALGKTIEISKRGSFEITGVLKKLPMNTHLAFESLVSYETLPQKEHVVNYETPFSYGLDFVYILVQDEDKLDNLNQYLEKLSKEISQTSGEEIDYYLQALSEITPGRDLAMLTGGLGPQWDYPSFYIFGTICLLILLPACFNYTNISIARAMKRAKEIGLRKTMGSQQQQIFFQFIAETVVVTMISLVGALILFFFVRGEFKSMMIGASQLDLSITWTTAGFFILFAIFVGILGGTAPALYFARLNPIQALKNQSSTKIFSGMWMRKSLTVFQFALSFGFIVALVVFARQYRYSMNYDFGFQKENILDVELQKADPDLFASEFSKLSSVQRISFSSDVLGLHPSQGDTWMQYENKTDSVKISEVFVSPGYIENIGLKFLAGTGFPEGRWNSEQHLIVNEQFLKKFQIATPADAIGKVVRVDKQDLQIIGVLKDFHFSSLREPITCFAFRTDPSRYRIANLKVSFIDAYTGITTMEKLWKSMGNEEKFEANFFDDQINGAYESYTFLLKIIGFLGLLAISISLLGMLGMVVYTSESRTKEVGIRKVMGASVRTITLLLSRDYLTLMGLACLLALPITMWIVDQMLSMQFYHVTISISDVLLSLFVLFALGLLTIGSQTYKTAMTNPADTLRGE